MYGFLGGSMEKLELATDEIYAAVRIGFCINFGEAIRGVKESTTPRHQNGFA